MKQNICDRFFSALAQSWPSPVRILLSGGAAAQIMGTRRPTLDVDFEAVLLDKTQNWEQFAQAIQAAEQASGIAAQFSQNIEIGSQISYLDYRHHLRSYKNFKAIQVFMLEPYYWSIGKITRYLDWDVQDLIAVFKNEKVDPLVLAKLWLKALKASPSSSELFLTKQHIQHFFKTFGQKIWGKTFPEEKINHFGF